MPNIGDIIYNFILTDGTMFASMISQMQKIEDKEMPTIASVIKNGRILLHYNPDYLDKLTIIEAKAVMEHECMHIAMEHHFRAKNFNMKLWNVATDLAINQHIHGLPKGTLTIENVFQDKARAITRKETAEYYYNELTKDKAAQQRTVGEGKCGCGEQFECDNSGGDGIGEELAKELVKQVVKQAVTEAQGRIPENMEKIVADLLKPSIIPWQQILKQFVSNSVKAGSKASWKRPNRRYGGVQKGRISDRIISLVVAIDTSGSIDDDMLGQFIDEIKTIQSCYKSVIHVIECDAKVHRCYKLQKYDKVKRDIKGGGGTDFAPVFQYLKD
ncbi:MAG: hypothetical protein HXY30_21150, partial [Pseudorhodoplanes sp.]|nr:hypothetical protein [Pseudorhodoplanes sp.]